MLICKLFINNIGYQSVLEKLMPVISKELTDKDNIFYTAIKNIISKDDKPTGITKFLLSVIPNKDDIAISVLQNYSPELNLYINELLDRYMIKARIKTLKAKTLEKDGGKLIRLDITIDDIDYEQTIINLIPLISELIKKQNSKAGRVVAIITENMELFENMVKAAINELPEDKRDELLVDILMEYKSELIDEANKAIIKNNIKAEIKNIAINNRLY